MFTGIIEQQGLVLANDIRDGVARIVIQSTWTDISTGESIAVNGVCLTVLAQSTQELHFDVSPETMRLTTLGNLVAGMKVNLERAMQASGRFGGHYVSGHVDTTAVLKSVHAIGDFVEMEFAGFSSQAMMFLIPKGSIAVEGVSLTINAVYKQSIKIMLVPHTLLNTNLSLIEVGQQVNIEFDYFTRIVAHQSQLAQKVNYEVKS